MNHPSDMPASERERMLDDDELERSVARIKWQAERAVGVHVDEAVCLSCEYPERMCGCEKFEAVCGDCGGQGFVEDGGCGGGCEFCRPFPKCNACAGTGRADVRP